MKGDFSRSTFRPEEQYTRVLQQQGRVQLDADWNEALDILIDRARTVRRDVIGHCGGPQGNVGFEISVDDDGNLQIGSGRYYVDGILVENREEQPFGDQDAFPEAPLPTEGGRYLFYLDVWERHITALEDPVIREVALGGPDTATRTRVIPQVKWQAVDEGVSCGDIGPEWVPDDAVATGTLAARSQPAEEEEEPCLVPPAAGYRRLENQLYRVEIHTAGPRGSATFKWSRENGAVVAEWVAQDDNTLTVAAEGRDDNLSFHPTDWVELTDDTRELQGRPGVLVQLADVQGRDLLIDPDTIADPDDPGATSVDLTLFGPTPKIRRWESEGAELVEEGPVENDGYLPLESGVEVRFGDGEYQTGDYWLIPARAYDTADVLWPRDETGEPEAQPRHGIHHYYCPLAILPFDADGGWGRPRDCRQPFPPLTDLPEGEVVEGGCCCGVSVGDGEISEGDFDNLQQAVEAVAEAGGSGTIRVLPGVHQLDDAVTIDDLEIAIVGCGPDSLIRNNGQTPVFVGQNARIRLADLAIQATPAPTAAIILSECRQVVIERCLVENRSPAGALPGAALYFVNCEDLTVRDCRLSGLPAVVGRGRALRLLENEATAGGFWIEGGSADVLIGGNHIHDGALQGVTLGGFRLTDGAEDPAVRRVAIRHNRIRRMAQSAIGSAVREPAREGLGRLSELTIAHNELELCVNEDFDDSFDGQTRGGIVLHGAAHVRIHDNHISGNGNFQFVACGIYLSWAVRVEIANNHIAGNGLVIGPADRPELPFFQGGIFLLPVVAGLLDPEGGLSIRPGAPAVQVHDNVVVAPTGPCLAAYGYGPMSIRDNAFTSQATCIQPNLEDDPDGILSRRLFEATCVSVLNLAMNARQRTQRLPVNPNEFLNRPDLLNLLPPEIPSAEDDGPPSAGQLAYHGNQSDQQGPRLPLADEFAPPSISLVSFGDLAVQDNQSICRLVIPADGNEAQQLADWRVLAETTRVQNNWVDEPFEHTLFSIVAYGERFCHASHNQAAECIYAAGGDVRAVENQVFNRDECEARAEEFGGLLPG